MLVDDHPVVRAGLRGLLASEPDIDVIAEAGSGNEAIARAGSVTPDVILMDLRMPDGDGVTATRRLAADFPIIVLTTYDTDADIVRAVAAGAMGYLLKDTTGPDLLRAIRSAVRGETVLAPSVAARLVHTVRAPAGGDLSERELEVLRLVADGAGNAEIGKRLHISAATVKTHLLRMYHKLGVNDRTAAVTTAVRRGLLRL